MLLGKLAHIMRRSKLLVVGGLVSVLLAFSAVFTIVIKQHISLANERSEKKEALLEGRKVVVVPVKRANAIMIVDLVGEARPYANVTLYAKISGYIKEINVDKGDQVKEGKILAVIDSPELNRQLEGAQADASNKRMDALRYKQLLKSGSVSQQSADTVETSAKVAEENAAMIRAQKEYEIVRAPFTGIITARYVDLGALVQSAVTSQTNSLPVVTLSRTDILRIYAYPDQKTAGLVRIGDKVEIFDSTKPNIRWPATIKRTTGELDAKTRTMLVEIEFDNSRGEILPGSLVMVRLHIEPPVTVEIPAQALMPQKNNPLVAVLSKDNEVMFRPVVVFDTDGRMVRLSTGVTEGEYVILNASEALREGETVRPIIQEHQSTKGAAAGK